MTNVTGSAEEREKFVAGFREFADWLEANPWAPIMRQSGFEQSAGLQIDLYGAEGLDEVRSIAARLGMKVNEDSNDRTMARLDVGSVSYAVIAWHPEGRPGEKDAELERLRAEVAALRAAAALQPDAEHYETSGWTGGDSGSGVACACGVQFDGFDSLKAAGEQLARHIADATSDPSGLGYSREADDPTPVSPARGLAVGAPLSRIAEDGHKLDAERPLVSDATIAEAAAMEERDRLAGGPPWEVPGHPDNGLLCVWETGGGSTPRQHCGYPIQWDASQAEWKHVDNVWRGHFAAAPVSAE